MNIVYNLLVAVLVATLIVVVLAVLWWIFPLMHLALTLPMRRAERARLFLDQVDFAIKQGRPVEETLISLSQSRDMSMGVRFHLVVAWLEQGLSLGEALARVPQFLPPQVNAMLMAGRKIGDLGKVLPACRHLLSDAVSHTRAALNYLFILTFVITPLGIWVATMLKIVVLPKFMELSHGLGMGAMTLGLAFVYGHIGTLIAIQTALLLLLWLAGLAYIGGPRVVAWFPVLQRCQYWLPWRRKRLQRDFSTMLATLLDSGMPEPEAVALAGDCTANCVFRHRAARAVDDLKQGAALPKAIAAMDDSGEFGWRLTNALHGASGGFVQALAGWHESLDAKAFQQEQAAAHGVTTALVLWSGVYVGVIVISVFMFLVSITNMGVLW